MAITFITPVDLTPVDDGTYKSIDVTAYVSANASGVIFSLAFDGSSTRQWNYRQGGSTDTTLRRIAFRHGYYAVGIDSLDVFEVNLQASANTYTLTLLGYFEDEDAYFLVNEANFSGSAGTWNDVDITAQVQGGHTAVAAIFKWQNASTVERGTGFRKNGSTDNRINDTLRDSYPGMFVVGVDANDICEYYIENAANGDALLVGYLKSTAPNLTVLTNGTDVSLTTTGAWTDLPNLPANITAGFFEVAGATTSNDDYGFRPDGATSWPAASAAFVFRGYGASGATSGVIEGWAETTAVDFYLLAYTASGGATSGNLSASGIATLTGQGRSTAEGDLAAAGAGTLTGQGRSTAEGDLAAAGAGAAAWTGTGILAGDLAAAGAGTLTGEGQSTASGDLSAAGAATLTGEGQSTASGDLAAAGAGTLTGEGQSTASGDLAAAGAGTAAFVGQTAGVSSGDLTSAGVATLTGQGQSTAEGDLAAAGLGALAGEGQSTASGDLAAAGAGTATWPGTGIFIGDLAAAGLGALAGEGQSTAEGDLAAAGLGALIGEGQSTASGDLAAAGFGAAIFQAAVDQAAGLEPMLRRRRRALKIRAL